MSKFFNKLFGDKSKSENEEKNNVKNASQRTKKIDQKKDVVGEVKIIEKKPDVIKLDENLVYFKENIDEYDDIINDYINKEYTLFKAIGCKNKKDGGEYEPVDLYLIKNNWLIKKELSNGKVVFIRSIKNSQLIIRRVREIENFVIFQLEEWLLLGDVQFSDKIDNHMYKCDLQKKHIFLENLEIYIEDEDGDGYYPIELKIMGNTVKIRECEDNDQFDNKGYPLNYTIINVIKEDLLEINLGYFRKVRINREEFEKFLNYNRKMNVYFFEKSDEMVMKIHHLMDKLIKNDKELHVIIQNFVSQMPEELMKDPIEICKFEMLFEFHDENKASKTILQTSEIERAKLRKLEVEIDLELEFAREKSCAEFKCDIDLTGNYYLEQFEYLVKIIQEKYENGLTMEFISGEIFDVSYYITLMMINKVVKEVQSELWLSEYNDYFTDIESLNLKESVERYFQIEVINHEDLNTGGTFIYFLMSQNKFSNNNNYIDCYDEFLDVFLIEQEKQKYQNYKQRLVPDKEKEKVDLISIDDIDLMNGYEFEYFIAKLFNNMGYKSEVTKASGDQGIDVVCEKKGKRIGIQAKCYAGSVGNTAVQEAVGGKTYYNLDKVMVITNSNFTKSALDLAQANDVVLWDRNRLIEKL